MIKLILSILIFLIGIFWFIMIILMAGSGHDRSTIFQSVTRLLASLALVVIGMKGFKRPGEKQQK